MENHADYDIVKITPDIVFIVDVNLGNKSITNDAEWVIEDALSRHPGKRIVYKDTEGYWDELVHENGRFTSFKPYERNTP